ncbi:SWIM zinc finger family protein [Methanocaldococcus indicus]|uniref:SWIM zinc finger family protein n=1 Tax=Methanocaldococcus indicus TaxID=213231 RepID=UPI003C6D79F4
MFDELVKKRGEQYFKLGLVRYCVKYKNYLFGEVVGSKIYKVKFNLDTLESICSCPYKYNCKHGYALYLAYKNNMFIDGEEIFNNIMKQSKEDIIKLLEKIITNNFLWEEFIEVDSLFNKIKNLIKLSKLEKKNIYTLRTFLKNNIKKLDDSELIKVVEELINNDVDDFEIYDIVIREIFNRDNQEIIYKLLILYRKNKDRLWIVEDYIIDRGVEELL